MHQLSSHVDGKLNLSSGAAQHFLLLLLFGFVWLVLFMGIFFVFHLYFLHVGLHSIGKNFWTDNNKQKTNVFFLCTLSMKKTTDSFGEKHGLI